MWDMVIVGAGIAGASAAYFLVPGGRVLLIEREAQPGYHATGRSAAVYHESYGPPQVRALTRASREFLSSPPVGFCEYPLLEPRQSLLIGGAGQRALLEGALVEILEQGIRARLLEPAEAVELVPILRHECLSGAVLADDVADIDVAAVHQGYLRGARQFGVELRCDTELKTAHRTSEGWRLQLGDQWEETRMLVNAAGAWADAVAGIAGQMPIALEPRRRTVFTLDAPVGCNLKSWPLIEGIARDWYMKPDAGRLMASPANADLTVPHDVQPEEIDIAVGMHRLGQVMNLPSDRPRHAWAGLRSFFRDGLPAAGFATDDDRFFWLAGQGGYGIQTSPALGMLASALLQHRPVPQSLSAVGVDASMLRPLCREGR